MAKKKKPKDIDVELNGRFEASQELLGKVFIDLVVGEQSYRIEVKFADGEQISELIWSLEVALSWYKTGEKE